MAEERVTNELIYETLKRMQERLGRLETGQADILTELRVHKSLLGALVSEGAVQDGRIAELTSRVDRVEHRLELREEN